MRVGLWVVICCCLGFASSALAAEEAKTDTPAQTIKNYLFNVPFTQISKFVVGDPVKWVATSEAPLSRVHLSQKIESFAYVLAFTGMLIAFWRARIHANLASFGQAFARFVIASILIGVSLNLNGTKNEWNISSIFFNAWKSAYTWSTEQFGDDVDAAMIEAQDALGDTIAQVTIASVSLTGAKIGVQTARAAAAGFAKGAAAAKAAAGKAAQDGLTTGLSQTVTTLLGKLKWTLNAFMPFLQTFAAIIYSSGIVMILALHLLPLAFALMTWGQWKPTYIIIMSMFVSVLVVTLLPWMFAVGVKIAFINPSQTIRFYNDEIAIHRAQAKINTAVVTADIKNKGTAIAADCKAAIAADPTGKAEEEDPACRALRGGSWLENLTTGFVDTLTQKLGIISDAINGLLNAVNTLFIGMVAVGLGMLLGLGMILMLPVIISNFLGVNWSGIKT